LLARQPLANGAAQRLYTLALGRQRGIIGEHALDLERMGGIEFAVDIGVNEQLRVGGGRTHG
jgi:hypothetical protein